MKLPGVFIITDRLTNPALTSDDGLPRRVHVCAPAHKNMNKKTLCVETVFG
jgi:hypothetical protein